MRLGGIASQRKADFRLPLGKHPRDEDEVLVRLKPDTLEQFADDYQATLLRHYDIPECMAGQFEGELALLQLPKNLSVDKALESMQQDPRVLVADSNDLIEAPSLKLESNQEKSMDRFLDPVAATFGWGSVPRARGLGPGHTKSARLAGKTRQEQSSGRTSVLEGRRGVRPSERMGRLWGMRDIDAQEAWKQNTGSRQGPVIAVIDTGVDYTHPDLAANIWTNPGEIAGDGIDNDGNGVIDDVHGFNAAEGTGDPMDENGHGTHVAGIIGAVGNNQRGVVGVNWQAQLMPIKFLGKDGLGKTSDAIESVLYANKMGARILNHSYTVPRENEILRDTLAASPALHVCAAGNQGEDSSKKPLFPASYDLENMISVASHDRSGELAESSNWGETVDLAAPGVGIRSTYLEGEYQKLSGTSMAAPHVTGTAALIVNEHPQISNQDIKRRILSGVSPLDDNSIDKVASGGKLNAGKAMEVDTTAPAPVKMELTRSGPRHFELSWQPSGDDGDSGVADDYELRVDGLLQPRGKNRLSAAVEIKPSGRPREVAFSVEAIDNVGNRSQATVLKQQVAASKVALEENFDQGAPGWTAEGGWALVDAGPGRGQVYTDSPDGTYEPRARATLTSSEFSLADFKDSKLYLDLKHSVEPRFDKVTVEVHGRGWFFRRWRNLATFEGRSDWKALELDLSKYDGQENLRLRICLHSDDRVHRDGVYVDNVVVSGVAADR